MLYGVIAVLGVRNMAVGIAKERYRMGINKVEWKGLKTYFFGFKKCAQQIWLGVIE